MCYELQHPVYLVPIIQQDLRQEETILQIADALVYLDQVVNDVFNRVQSRIEESKAKLEKLRKRESLAKLKVEKLTGSSKATKVNPYVYRCTAHLDINVLRNRCTYLLVLESTKIYIKIHTKMHFNMNFNVNFNAF